MGRTGHMACIVVVIGVTGCTRLPRRTEVLLSTRNRRGMNMLIKTLFWRVVTGVAIDASGMTQYRLHLKIQPNTFGSRI